MNVLLRITGLLVGAVFWMIAGGLAIAALCFGCGLGLAPVAAVGGPFGALLLLLTWTRVAAIVRKRRTAMVLRHLHQALRLNLPLEPMLAAAQRSEKGAARTQLADLRTALAAGNSVAQAVTFAMPDASPRVVGVVAQGEQIGRLPQTVRRLVEEDDHAMRQESPDTAFAFGYGVVLVVFLTSVLGFIVGMVAPKYVRIFEDFGSEMPWITQVTLGAWTGEPSVLFIIIPVLLVLGFAGWALRGLLHPPLTHDPLLASMTGWLLWWLPITRTVVRDRGLADAFEFTVEALKAGLPLHRAAEEAAQLPVNPGLRRRLRRWADALNDGLDLRTAARAAAMPALVVGLFGTATATSDPQPALSFLARYYRYRFSRLAVLARAAALPLLTLALAAVVAWVVLSLFLPLVDLIMVSVEYARGI